MRVFITGASGYVGKAVAEAFRQAGHQVTGLVRSEEKALELKRAEIIPLLGDLAKPETYMKAIKNAEVVIHCGFENSPQGVTIEGTVVGALLEGTRSAGTSARTLLYTSGVWTIGSTGSAIADEASPKHPIDLVKWRVAMEDRLFQASSRHLRTVVLSPGCVYGGAGRLTNMWFSSAQEGSVEIVGQGQNRWAMVHYRDLAQAYLLAAEKELSGVVLNVTDNTRYTVEEMALAAAQAAEIPGKIHLLSEKEAEKKYGKLTQGLLIDQQVSSERASRLLGWHPRHKSFISDISLYYQSWKAGI